MDTNQVMRVLPQKPPFLMVDKILEMVPGKKAVGLKMLGANEPYFSGHFPGNPIMPGVLLIEAINQVGECALLSDPKFTDKIAFITGCNNVRFKRPAVPGDMLVITTEILDSESKIGTGKGKIEIDGKLACEADVLFYVPK
jgi:3-hydroxyacyl-[acyl-carrier-protein] dehydratase